MGYFANGSEGDYYQERFCHECVNDDPDKGRLCAVWGLHLEHNYGASDDMKKAMDHFIPRIGPFNGACRMFVARDPEWAGREDEIRKEWDRQCRAAAKKKHPQPQRGEG